MKNGIGTVEVLTEGGLRSYPHEEEVLLVPNVTRVRMATAAALAACTLTGNVLEANAAGAVGDIDTTVTPAVGDLILVKNQVAGAQNGVYEFLSVGGTTEKWKLRRAVGWDVSARVKAGRLVIVSEGTANANTPFMLATNDPIVLNTTVLVFGAALAVAPGAGSITHAMLDGDCVDGDNVADDAIDSEHIADGAIDSEHIADGAIDTAHIANAQVTAAKLATDNAASVEVDHEDTSPVTLLAAAAGVTRLVRVTAVCTETLGGTTPATMAVGTAGTPELVLSAAALEPTTGGGDIGDVTDGQAVLPAGQALICTVTDGVDGTPAGKITFLVTATPMPAP